MNARQRRKLRRWYLRDMRGVLLDSFVATLTRADLDKMAARWRRIVPWKWRG